MQVHQRLEPVGEPPQPGQGPEDDRCGPAVDDGDGNDARSEC